MLRRFVTFTLVSIVSVVLDQWSKIWAVQALEGKPMESFLGDTARLVFARNEGAFLSLGANLPPPLRFAILTVGVGVLLLGISIYTVRSPKVTLGDAVGYALIVSGGGSNFFDRARFGAVVDFMNLGIGSLRTGIFNIADLAIIAGIIVLFFVSRANEKKAKAAADAAAVENSQPAAQPPAP